MINMTKLDKIDRTLLQILRHQPRTPVAELARLASVARGTAQARISRLEDSGVIASYGPDVNATAIGFGVLAFVTLEIAQTQDDTIIKHLAAIPEVLEVHAVTGPGDLLCRVVARSNEHLDQVLQQVLSLPQARRTMSQLVLNTRLRRAEVDLAISVQAV